MRRWTTLLLSPVLGLAAFNAAACYTVYDRSDRVVYQSERPPGRPTTIRSIRPNRPFRTYSHAVRKKAELRCWLPVCQVMPVDFTTSAIRRPSATVSASGFCP